MSSLSGVSADSTSGTVIEPSVLLPRTPTVQSLPAWCRLDGHIPEQLTEDRKTIGIDDDLANRAVPPAAFSADEDPLSGTGNHSSKRKLRKLPPISTPGMPGSAASGLPLRRVPRSSCHGVPGGDVKRSAQLMPRLIRPDTSSWSRSGNSTDNCSGSSVRGRLLQRRTERADQSGQIGLDIGYGTAAGSFPPAPSLSPTQLTAPSSRPA